MRYILGIDLGTTAVKAALFDENGAINGSKTIEYQLSTPSPQFVELDADVYRRAFADAVRGALEKSGCPPKDIVSLAVSAQGETLFFLDENGNNLRPAIVWMDNRAGRQSDAIEAAFTNPVIHRRTGQVSASAAWPSSKILWVRENQPEVFGKTDKFLLIEDYFIYLLTGRMVSEGSLLCSTLYWDIETHDYWDDMLQFLGIRRDQLPDILEPGAKVGALTDAAALEFGLAPGMTVALGALDQACGAIGVGNVRPGVFSESTGAALATVAMSDRLALDPNREMPCFYSGIPGMYMIHSFSTGGMAVRWYRDNFCPEELLTEKNGGKPAYQLMDELASAIPPGSDGLVVLPHLQGSGAPDTVQNATGVFMGVGLMHTQAHFIRALLEGVTNVLRRMLDATVAMGVTVTEIRSLSGGAKSRLWCQMKADATGIPVKTMQNTENAACLGAAILAGVAAGVWPSVQDAADRFCVPDKIYEPDPAHKPAYDALLLKYRRLFDDLKETFASFSG